jgi:hypothetical protein
MGKHAGLRTASCNAHPQHSCQHYPNNHAYKVRLPCCPGHTGPTLKLAYCLMQKALVVFLLMCCSQ